MDIPIFIFMGYGVWILWKLLKSYELSFPYTYQRVYE